MKKRELLLGAALLVIVGGVLVSGSGSTIGTHLKSYKGNVSQIVSNLMPKNSQAKTEESTAYVSTATVLDTPGDFVVSESGGFSFSGVDDASFYLIYFCEPEATGEGDDYLFSSDPIYDDGSESYSGKFSDQFNFSYGDYLVKVYAFPELTDSEYEKSSAVMSSYVYTGEIDNPEVDYFWNTNDGILEAVLANVETYTYQAYPDEVEFIFVNTEDDSDVVTAKLEEVSEDNNVLEIEGLTKGATYQFSAVSRSNSEFVTNNETDEVVISNELLLGDVNILSENYIWSDGWATFPRLMENFDLKAGGNAGTAYGKFRAMSADSAATPVAANSGSDYSYTLLIDFGGVKMSGTLELKSDGTLEYSESGGGPVAAGTITGSWKDNGNGTATLSYVPAEISS